MGALRYASMILAQAKQCLNQALLQAVSQSTAAGKVFSPQNWFKSRSSVDAETLAAGMGVAMLRGMRGGQETINGMKLGPESFGLRWSAD